MFIFVTLIFILQMSNVPENANESCPGTDSENAGKASGCAGCPNQKFCSTGEKPVDSDIEFIRQRLALVKNKVRQYNISYI